MCHNLRRNEFFHSKEKGIIPKNSGIYPKKSPKAIVLETVVCQEDGTKGEEGVRPHPFFPFRG